MTPALVSDGVLAAAERTPDAPAIFFGDEVITYSQLAQRIRSVAAGVDAARALRVAVSMANHPTLLEIFFGSTLAGAVFVLFEPRWPRDTIDHMMQAHAPHLLFTSHESFTSWRDQQDGSRALLAQPTAQMPFLIGFTSGTTGLPKAFIRSHETWMKSFAASAIEYGISTNTRMLVPGPLSHGLSLYAAVETLNAGGTVFMAPHFDARAMMNLACSGSVNTIAAAPTLLDLMLSEKQGQSNTTMQTIITAGAKLPPKLRNHVATTFPKADVIEYYGASELSFVSISKTNENCPVDSVGRAFRGVELKVARDDGTHAGVGEIGIVWVRSAMVSSGYVGETDGTGFRTQNGWATVGDRGSLDDRGFLTLVGREGDMIISGGLNVYPQEVEAALMTAPSISEVLVVGELDARWGQVVTAVIAPVSGAVPNVAALKQHCVLHLESHKHPRRWLMIEHFKHTASGKIDRADVLARLRASALKVLV